MSDIIVTGAEDLAAAVLLNEWLASGDPLDALAKRIASHAAQARLDALEEAANHARCAFDERPRRDGIDWNDGFDDGTKAAATAIRSLSTRGDQK